MATSYEDFSNEPNSKGTPTGYKYAQGKREGLFGEVISTLNTHASDARYFTNFNVTEPGTDGRDRVRNGTFVNGMTIGSQRIPEVISAAVLLDGARGIWIHGCPRMGLSNIPPEERRQKAGSTGCIRISNGGAMDILQYVEMNTPVYIYGKNPERGPDLNLKFK
jgi:hypothetical protein